MTCREFSSYVLDLAREPLSTKLPSMARDEVGRHAETCASCAALLSEQRDLSTALKQLASQTVVRGSTLEEEATLLAAFRREFETTGRPVAEVARPNSWRPWALAIAIAAMLVATVGSLAMLNRVSGWFAIEDAPTAIALAIPPPDLLRPIPTPPMALITTRQNQALTTAEASTYATPVPDPQDTASARVAEEASASSLETHAATSSEFVPLLYGGDPMLADSGPVVRVEFSGATLQTLGFPIIGDAFSRRVQADVMLGQDGVARAIRLVQ